MLCEASLQHLTVLTQCTSAARCASPPGPLHISCGSLRVHPLQDRLHQRHAMGGPAQLQNCASQALGPTSAGRKCRMVRQARSGQHLMRQLGWPSLGCSCVNHVGPPRQEGQRALPTEAYSHGATGSHSPGDKETWRSSSRACSLACCCATLTSSGVSDRPVWEAAA